MNVYLFVCIFLSHANLSILSQNILCIFCASSTQCPAILKIIWQQKYSVFLVSQGCIFIIRLLMELQNWWIHKQILIKFKNPQQHKHKKTTPNQPNPRLKGMYVHCKKWYWNFGPPSLWLYNSGTLQTKLDTVSYILTLKQMHSHTDFYRLQLFFVV